jgi:hypothetical protein
MGIVYEKSKFRIVAGIYLHENLRQLANSVKLVLLVANKKMFRL